MNIEARISAFSRLGQVLNGLLDSNNSAEDAIVQDFAERFEAVVGLAHARNNWFMPQFTRAAVASIAQSLSEADQPLILTGLIAARHEAYGAVRALSGGCEGCDKAYGELEDPFVRM